MAFLSPGATGGLQSRARWLASQLRGGGSLGAYALLHLGLRCPLQNLELETNEELHGFSSRM